MKKIILTALFVPAMAIAQTYPSPTFSSLTLQNPLTAANGGTGASTSTGSGSVVLSSGATLANPTITGTLTATGLVTTANLATQAANTVLANATGSSASPSAFSMPGCSSTSSALQWASGSGFACGTVAASGANSNITSITGLTTALSTSQGGLGANNGAASGVPVFSSGAATVTATTGTGSPVLATSPALVTPTATTAALGTNTTQIATTAFIANRGPCANIMDFGGNNAGSANNDTALTNALAAASNTSLSKCVYFPPGQFNFASQAGYTYTSHLQAVTFQGAGADVTTLYWPGGAGLGFNLKYSDNSVHVQNLTVTTGSNGATGAGILLTNSFASTANSAQNSIDNVTVRGQDGYGISNYWQYGIDIIGVSNVNISGVEVYGGTATGTGLIIGTGSSSIIPIIYNISHSGFYNLNIGFSYNAYTQGVTVVSSNFTNNNYGIYIPAGQVLMDQLSVSNSQFNSLTNGFNIYLLSAISNVGISNNTFLINNNSSGFNLQNGSGITTVTGNSFSPNTGSPSSVYGIVINGHTVAGTIITGNSFYNLTQGVALQAGSASVNVQSNVYNSCTTNTANAGTGNVIGGGSP